MGNRLISLTRPEFVADIAFTANTPVQLSTRGGQLPGDFYYWGMLLEVEGRLVVGTAAADLARADNPFGLVERITIEGFHRIRKQNEIFYDLRGSDIRELALQYGSRAPRSTAAIPVTVQTNDFRFFLPIVFPPEKLALLQQIPFLLDVPNYDALTLTLRWGDGTSILDPAPTTTFTFSAFGVGTGSPRARVHGIYSTFGPDGPPPGFVPARPWRYFKENATTDFTASGSDLRIFEIPRGNRIRSILLKTGVKADGTTGITAGNNSYDTLSEAILDNIQVNRGINKTIRQYIDYRTLAEYCPGESFAITPTAGYGLIDFCENGDIRTSLDTRELVAGPSGDVDVHIRANSTGAARQAGLAVFQEVRGEPIGFPFRR